MSGKPQNLRHQEERLRNRLTKAKGTKSVRAATRMYLDSYAAKFVALEEVASLKKFSLKRPLVQSVAQEMSVFEHNDEKVILHPEEKPNQPGNFRYLLSFGPLNRSKQVLVRNALQARWQVHPDQTQFNGGRETAIKLARKHYRRGFRHVFELDVYHFFRSFDKAGMSSYLSLPERVVTNVLSGDELNIVLSPQYGKAIDYTPADAETPLDHFADIDSEWGPVRSGLTEGSMVSPFAAELLLAWVLENVPIGAWRIVNYADNFLCLCENEQAASELTQILRKLLHQHPAGPLQVKLPAPVFLPGQAFEFLGYWLVPENPIGLRAYMGDKTQKKARRLRKEAYQTLASPSLTAAQKLNRFKKIEARHRSYVNAFPSWSGRDQFHQTKMAKLISKTGIKD